MARYLASLAAVFLTSAAPFAQKPGDPVPLIIHPAELPQPSLKYRLFPDQGELTDGNAATQYYRALSLLVENPKLLKELQAEYWYKWLALPLKELPRQEIETKLHIARGFLRELEIGSKRKHCDWQREKWPEGFDVLTPEGSSLRLVVFPLAVRARLYIAEGKWSAACETLQSGFALAHHFAQGPRQNHCFIALSLAKVMTDQVETLLQQPDAPNLYWGLTVLPKPFVDLQPMLHHETLFIEALFPWMEKLDATPMSDAQVKVIEESIERALKKYKPSAMTAAERASHATLLTRTTAEGKRQLVARCHFTSEQVAAMPSFQVAALFAHRDYKEAREEVLKWVTVQEGWKYSEYKTAQQRYSKALNRIDDLYCRQLLIALGPGEFQLEGISLGAARIDRRLAALRCIEALRLYAAKHDGKLPTALADVKELPVPGDPLTGKAFLYTVKGDKASLSLVKPEEKKPSPYEFLTYYLTLERAKK